MEDIRIPIPEYIERISRAAEKSGAKIYLVGGCVRDALSGREPHDYDMCITAPYESLHDIFSDFRTAETGRRYGTLTVISDGKSVEVTASRRESGYSDNRRPDLIEFTPDICDDLRRRDFTVNAMAYSASEGLIDPFKGKEDLDGGVLRCVGTPERRFGEDALRIMRAIRFSATLGFTLDKKTDDAVHRLCHTLENISGERLRAELLKLLCGDSVSDVLRRYSDVMCAFIPELRGTIGFPQNNPHHIYTVYEHIIRSVEACPKDALMRCVMLLHDVDKPAYKTTDANGIDHFKGHPAGGAATAEKILRRLAFPKKDIEKICFLILHHDERPEPERKSIRRYVSRVGSENAMLLTEIRRADLAAQAPEFAGYSAVLDETERMIESLEAEKACVTVCGLDICGDDIIALGVPRGKEIGEVLSYLLTEVTNENIKNERSQLLSAAKKFTEQKEI